MIRAIPGVIRGEGVASALTRAKERLEEGAESAGRRIRGLVTRPPHASILNVSINGIAPRLGGVQTQLRTRLREESHSRPVALLIPGTTRTFGEDSCEWRLARFAPTTRTQSVELDTAVHSAVSLTGARTIHFEGTCGLPLATVLGLMNAGLEIVVSVHDFSLFSDGPHLQAPALPMDHVGSESSEQHPHRVLAARLLSSARGLIFPSEYLLEEHRRLFALPLADAAIVAPGIDPLPVVSGDHASRRGIAFAGSVQRHKGGHLFEEVIDIVNRNDVSWHVFGGGDEHLLRALRAHRGVSVHGYYRSGALPSLLTRNGIGLVVLASIVPESFSLTLSEAWSAGANVVAFDHGAIASRVETQGGRWLAPAGSGAKGLARLVEQWCAYEEQRPAPGRVPSVAEAAAAQLALYEQWALL